jgi:hypothetical protein
MILVNVGGGYCRLQLLFLVVEFVLRRRVGTQFSSRPLQGNWRRREGLKQSYLEE